MQNYPKKNNIQQKKIFFRNVTCFLLRRVKSLWTGAGYLRAQGGSFLV